MPVGGNGLIRGGLQPSFSTDQNREDNESKTIKEKDAQIENLKRVIEQKKLSMDRLQKRLRKMTELKDKYYQGRQQWKHIAKELHGIIKKMHGEGEKD